MQPGSALEVHYETIDPDSVDGTDDPDDDLTEKLAREPEKVAIIQSRAAVFVRTIFYLLPVGFSFGILQLSFRHVYWRGTETRDASPYSVNEILNVLQLVAKAHEILIITSLSHLVLFYLRQQLCSSSGPSFGLFTSAYQITFGSPPLTQGFWQTSKLLIRKEAFQWRALGLFSLIVLTGLFGLAAGPASAIAVIPRLDWWHYQDLFSLYEHPDDTMVKNTGDFSLYIPKPLFPSEVNSSSLPGVQCLVATPDVDGPCPFAGYDALLRSFSLTALRKDNLTITDPTTLNRRMATSMPDVLLPPTQLTGRLVSQSMAWTQSQVLANYLSLGWQSGLSDDPYIVGTQLRDTGILSPVVNVSCEMEPSANYKRNLSFFSDPYGSENRGPSQRGFFDIRSIWNETILFKPSKTRFEWRVFFQDSDDPVLAAFILSPSTERGTSSNVTMCGVEARWDEIDMWIMSSGEGIITSNFTWDTETGPPNNQEQVFPVARLRKDWADSLNAASANSSTVLAELIDNALQVYYEQVPVIGAPVDAQTKILSMAVADGLARIGAEYNVNQGVSSFSYGGYDDQTYDTRNSTVTLCRRDWCSQGYFVDSIRGPAILNGTVQDFRAYYEQLSYVTYSNVTNLLRSFPEPTDIATSWTQVAFPVQRYGYGWGFNTVAVQVATAILILHAIIIVVHCCNLMYSGLKYSFIGSLGDLVALALVSEKPAAFKSASVGVARGSTWSQPIAILEVGEKEFGASKLALVVGEDLRSTDKNARLHRRPVVGRGYE